MVLLVPRNIQSSFSFSFFSVVQSAWAPGGAVAAEYSDLHLCREVRLPDMS